MLVSMKSGLEDRNNPPDDNDNSGSIEVSQ